MQFLNIEYDGTKGRRRGRARRGDAAMTKVGDNKAMQKAVGQEVAIGRDPALPVAQGLYDPSQEHDSCGVGFVADMHNRKTHAIVEMGLQILLNLDHRGAVGADPKLGDGCGILVQIPHDFFKAECKQLGFDLPAAGDYAIGQFFMPRDPETRAKAKAIIDAQMKDEGVVVLGWRDLPVDSSDLGDAVKAVEPFHMQLFIGRGPEVKDHDDFERRIYLARKSASNGIYALENGGREFYSVSVSTRTIVYKGMVLVSQLGSYFLDLKDERFVSAIALVHQRFATNTFPSWRLAHPYRFVAHNGEINTLRGNLNGWRRGRRRCRRRCSATISASSGLSPMRASRTPPVSTMRSNSWCAAAIRWPMR
jgi:glutamate synthase (NADPH/NADH) large chain